MSERQTSVTEIAPGVFRIATYHDPWRCSMNQYLVVDREPALISTGLRAHFDTTWAAIGQVMDPLTIRHVIVMHYEADECGALNEILDRAPLATALASMRTVLSSLGDFAMIPPRGLGDGELIATGADGVRVLEAPYVPAWDGIILAHESTGTVFTSGLFIQPGLCDPISKDDRSALSAQLYRTFYGVPPEAHLLKTLDRIEAMSPRVLAPGHGSAIVGNLLPYFRAYRALAGETRGARREDSLTSAYR